MSMKEVVKVVKIGGNVINDPLQLELFLKDFAQVEGKKILIHGGGKKATELANQLGLEPKMVNGRRITDEANLEIVTMVYAGLLNKKIVALLQNFECNAIGLSGADGNSIKAHKRILKEVDYGFAGDVDAVNGEFISALLKSDTVPVFCAITHDQNGQLLNTNADTIASEVAKGLIDFFEVELIFCFEKQGVLEHVEDEESVIAQIDSARYQELKKDKIIAAGMLPKMENSFSALQNGVRKVVIGNPSILNKNTKKFTTLVL